MAETTGATEAQAAEVTQPQAGAGSSSPAEGAQATAESGTGNSDHAALVRERDEARREAARYRTEARKLTEAQQAADEAKLSEVEKANRRVTELEGQLAEFTVRERERTLQLAAIEAASRLNFRNPDLAFRLLNPAEIEFAEDGRPKNVEKLLRALLEREPYLAKTAQADFGGGNRGLTPTNPPSMNQILRAAAKGG